MTQDTWNAVDRYIADTLLPPDPALEAAVKSSDAAGLPPIAVAPNQGKLLHLLARAMGARRILEVGTLGGYSTIWLARALPEGGRMVTLEFEPRHAEVARANLARAGLADRVEVRVGRAIDSMPGLLDEGLAPFDLVFIDADKEGYPGYLEWSLRLTRKGSLIVADNVVRNGKVTDAASTDRSVQGVRRFNAMLAAEPRVDATVIQTVGVKGWDGLAFALVVADP